MAYYRTPEGKVKKQLQNGKRSLIPRVSQVREAVQGPRAHECCPPKFDNGSTEPRPEPVEPLRPEPESRARFDRGMVLYLAMAVGLIERRVVSPAEIEELLCRVMRQHSIARRRRLEYAVWYLNNKPP